MSNQTSPSIEASDLLAEALKQMDGLLATRFTEDIESTPKPSKPYSPNHFRNDGYSYQTLPAQGSRSFRSDSNSNLAPRMQQAKVVRLIEELYQTVVDMHDSSFLKQHMATDNLVYVREWLASADNGNDSKGTKASDMHKLDLLAEISTLRLKLATAERDQRHSEEKYAAAQKRLDDMQSQLNDQNIELTSLRNKIAQNLDFGGPRLQYTASLSRADTRIDPGKKVVETLRLANQEKDQRIDELARMLTHYQQLDNVYAVSQGRRYPDPLDNYYPDTQSDTSSNCNSVTSSSGTNELASQDSRGVWSTKNGPNGPTPVTSTPNHVNLGYGRKDRNGDLESPPSSIMSSKVASPASPTNNGLPPVPLRKCNSASNASSMKVNPIEGQEDAIKDQMALQYKQLCHQTSAESKKQKKGGTIKNLFGKLKRSNSQEFIDAGEGFKRGTDVRATAAARLGTGRGNKEGFSNDDHIPFSRWNSEKVAAWLEVIGLGQYANACKKWLARGGEQLLGASSHELEKELQMKSPLHRKKLQLAVTSLSQQPSDDRDKLDHRWVTRWLDDIGLPQYKDAFAEARIDGRMLHAMTVEDLLQMKVVHALHHASIKCGIQVLRLHRYDASCLRRRPVPGEGPPTASDILLWTNHRVMEWLRSVDLAEYAPNMRGSGVHGGLMILEPRYTPELMATLLSIPPTKTLLRRHLNTHFVELIGASVQQRKREVEASGSQSLLPTIKVKSKKSFFGSNKESEEDYLCPPNAEIPGFKENRSSHTEFIKEEDKSALEDEELPTSTV